MAQIHGIDDFNRCLAQNKSDNIQQKRMRARGLSTYSQMEHKNHLTETEATQTGQNKNLTNSWMSNIISNNQQFLAKIVSCNNAGIELIRAQKYQEALLHLEEAERILEYAASCGKTIQRYIITSTLHNEACAYQKLWELQKYCDYMEAILYNMISSFNQIQQVQITHQHFPQDSPEYKNLGAYLHRRLLTVVYRLQYSAINSQIGKHAQAISSTEKALNLLSEFLEMAYSLQCSRLGTQNDSSKFNQLWRQCQGLDRSLVHSLISSSQRAIKRVQQGMVKNQLSPELRQMVKFSIGQVMQVEPISIEESSEAVSAEVLLSSKWLYIVAYYISIAYYIKATELRFLNRNISDPKSKQIQFQKSQIYHLNSIRIAIEYVPCISEYFNHIQSSLKNHYQIDLFADLPDSKLNIFEPTIFSGTQSEYFQQEINVDYQHFLDSEYPKLNSQQILVGSKTTHKITSNMYEDQHKLASLEKTNHKRKKSKESVGRKVTGRISNNKLRSPSIHINAQKSPVHVMDNKSSQKTLRVSGKKKDPARIRESKTSNSNEKTKDEPRKADDKKQNRKKKVMDEYSMGLKPLNAMDRKKKAEGKERKSGSAKKLNSLKSLSKEKTVVKSKKQRAGF